MGTMKYHNCLSLLAPLPVALLLAMMTAQCKHSSSSQVAGVVATGDVKWPNATASVCWENPETLSNNTLEFIENLIISEYNTRTVFKFTPNWKKCESTSRGLRVLFSATQEHSSVSKAFGRDLDGVKPGITFNFLFPKAETYRCTGETIYRCSQEAIYEFGHAIGLRHEHEHRDSTCYWKRDTNSISMGPYDPFSIMDYCLTDIAGATELGTLSAGDIATINDFYGKGREFSTLSPSAQCAKDGFAWQDSRKQCCAAPEGATYPKETPLYSVCSTPKKVRLSVDGNSADSLPSSSEMSYEGILSCATDGQKNSYYRGTPVPGGEFGVFSFSLPPWVNLRCGELSIAKIADSENPTSIVYQLIDATKPLATPDGLTLNGTLSRLKRQDSLFINETSLTIQLPLESTNLGIKGVRLVCNDGLYWGEWEDSNAARIARFQIPFPLTKRQQSISCTKLEGFNGVRKNKSTKTYITVLKSPSRLTALAKKNQWDLTSTPWTPLPHSYSLCDSNKGQGFGYPFKCGQEDCSFKSQAKVGSKDKEDRCLFRTL
jgi:hypothetical protein